MSIADLKLITGQTALVRRCEEDTDRGEEAVRTLRTELAGVRTHLQQCEDRLQDTELLYLRYTSEARRCAREVAHAANSFSKEHCAALLLTKSILARAVASSVCTFCGFADCSWDFFSVKFIQTLLQQFRMLREALLGFNSSAVSATELATAVQVAHEHGLARVALPRELQLLVTWLLAACDLTNCELAAAEVAKSLPPLASEKTEAYCRVKDLERDIDQQETRLARLRACADAASSVIRKLRAGVPIPSAEVDEAQELWRQVSENSEGTAKQLQELNVREVANDTSRSHKVHDDEECATLHIPKPSYDESVTPLILTENDPREAMKPRKPKRRKNRCCGLG